MVADSWRNYSHDSDAECHHFLLLMPWRHCCAPKSCFIQPDRRAQPMVTEHWRIWWALSAWWTMEWGSWHWTGDRDQDHPLPLAECKPEMCRRDEYSRPKATSLVPGPRVPLCVCESLSHVQLLVTPWNVARQASWPTESSRQEYWSGLPFPLPGVLPDPGMETESPTVQADSLPSEPPGNPICSFSSQQSPHSFSLLILFWPFISWASENQMAKWQLGGRYSMHENNGVKECGASIHTSPVKSRDFVPNGNKPGFVTSVHILWSRWDSVLSKNLTPLLYLAVCPQKLLRWLRDKESVYPAGEGSLVPGWRRSPGQGNGNRLQDSCLGNLRDGGAGWSTVHGMVKQLDLTQQIKQQQAPPKWGGAGEPAL